MAEQPFYWIRPEDYTLDIFLLFDRWIIRYVITQEISWYDKNRDYKADLAKALSKRPYIAGYCRKKAPEVTDFLDRLHIPKADVVSAAEAREAEIALLAALECFVVYADPEVMEKLDYIRYWDPQRLYELVDLEGKIVLDVGSGTGRLAFAAAKYAKQVYASDPCGQLREFMRDKIKRKGISNVKVLDGEILCLPYEADTFDVVCSGHVVGDFYDEEIAEMARVTKNGGWIVCCDGDDGFRSTTPDRELISRGFEYFGYKTRQGGNAYNYRKLVRK